MTTETMNNNNDSRKKFLAIGYSILVLAVAAGFFFSDISDQGMTQASADSVIESSQTTLIAED